MNFCQFCKTEIRKQDKFCIGCGNTLPQDDSLFQDDTQRLQNKNMPYYENQVPQGRRAISPILEDVPDYSYGKREIGTDILVSQQNQQNGTYSVDVQQSKQELSSFPQDFSPVTQEETNLSAQSNYVSQPQFQNINRGKRELTPEVEESSPVLHGKREITSSLPISPEMMPNQMSLEHLPHGKRELSPYLEDVSEFSHGKREILTESREFYEAKNQRFHNESHKPDSETLLHYQQNQTDPSYLNQNQQVESESIPFQYTQGTHLENDFQAKTENSELHARHLGYSTAKGIPQEGIRDFSPETEDFSQQSYGRREFLSQSKVQDQSQMRANINNTNHNSGIPYQNQPIHESEYQKEDPSLSRQRNEKDFTKLNEPIHTSEAPIHLDWDSYYTAKGKAQVFSQQIQQQQQKTYIPREENPFRKEKQRILSSQTRMIDPVTPVVPMLDSENTQTNSYSTVQQELNWNQFYTNKEESTSFLSAEQQQLFETQEIPQKSYPKDTLSTSQVTQPLEYSSVHDSSVSTPIMHNAPHLPSSIQANEYTETTQHHQNESAFTKNTQFTDLNNIDVPLIPTNIEKEYPVSSSTSNNISHFPEKSADFDAVSSQRTTELPKFKNKQQIPESLQKTTEIPAVNENFAFSKQNNTEFQKTSDETKQSYHGTPEIINEPIHSTASSEYNRNQSDLSLENMLSNNQPSFEPKTSNHSPKIEHPQEQYQDTPVPQYDDSRLFMEKTSELPPFVESATVLDEPQRKKVKEKTGKLPKMTEEQMRGKRAVYDHESTQDEVFMHDSSEEKEQPIKFQRHSDIVQEKSANSASNKSEFAHIKKRLGKVFSNHDTNDLWYMANRKQSLLQIIFIAFLCASGVVFLQFDTFATEGVQDFDGQMTLLLFALSFFIAIFHGIQVGMMGRLASDLAYQQEQLSICKYGICGTFEAKEFAATYDKVKKIAVEPYEPMGGGKMRGFYPVVNDDGKVSFRISKGRSLAITLSSGEIYYFNYLGNIEDLVEDIPGFAKLYQGEAGHFFETRVLTKNEAEPLPEAVARIQMTEYHSLFNVAFVIIFVILIYFSF